MHKEILSREELNPKIMSGLNKIATAVKRTLGPGGLPFIIQRMGQDLRGEPLGPKITKDGVSVANECSAIDETEDLIMQAVKHICRKTNAIAGDGTTTAIVLGEAIVKETLKVLEEDPNLNPQLVRESLEEESKVIIEELKKLAKPIKDFGIIKQVATISANGDVEIGKALGDAFKAVGAEGVVTVDEGMTNHITLEVVEGYQINRGAEAQDKFFNNKDQTRFEGENAALIIFDGDLYNYTDLVPAMNIIYGIENGKPTKDIVPIVVMANSFSREVIQFMLIQKIDSGLNICAVKGAHTTTVRSGYYDDIAILTGGDRLGNGGKSLKNFEEGNEGLIGKVIIDKYKCTFYDCRGDDEEVLKRVDQLTALKKKAESPYDTQIINDRLGALTGGIAKIGVGGATEFEIKEKYDRMEDALNASRAAIEEGIVAGGGVTLLKIAQKYINNPDCTLGQKILGKALCYPFDQILDNVGVKDVSISKILESDNIVYDARNKKMTDYMEAGIIDPVKVTRAALENAISISSLLITAGGCIVYKRDK